MSEPMLPRGQLRLDAPGMDDVSGDPDRDTWTTPSFITEPLGEFDLDPCSNERSKVKARRVFRLDRGQDGLILARFVSRRERVFVNCPYSRGQVEKWIAAYKHTRFVFLLRFDTSTKWFSDLMEVTAVIALLREQRMNFDPPPGVASGSNAFPHGLFFSRREDVSDEIARLCYLVQPCR